VDGSWGAEILDGLGRLADDAVITKKRSSAFFSTDLDLVLRGLGVERLIVGGTSTNWAIESTVRDGDSRDYEMVVVREATGARIRELHAPVARTPYAARTRPRSVAASAGGPCRNRRTAVRS